MLDRSIKDEACWNLEATRGYSVRSGMQIISQMHYGVEISAGCLEAINSIWGLVVPYRIKAFGWRWMLNRLSTRDLLSCRGIILSQQEGFCVFFWMK